MKENEPVHVPVIDAKALAAQALRALQSGSAAVNPMNPSFRSAPEFTAINEQEQFRKIEELLARALQKTELTSEPARALNRLVPEQHDYNLLLIEALTTLFEGYRALRYQASLLTNLQQTMFDLVQNQAAHAQSLERRIDVLESLNARPVPGA